ncbi:hypothetical protein IE4771_PB00273 (plasmid) [Rhizobium etli bv. mimosae str. IE4771]|uniref:Uncharacterized protein n=1 Tax=Rhizobium etli bv. mimosae str. IE4771 TaxID=1432050 RepID=A0A060IE85_RHIET|nr:hypothetical protein IE4771_PB00273 [Rhizobium sp. IE4771]
MHVVQLGVGLFRTFSGGQHDPEIDRSCGCNNAQVCERADWQPKNNVMQIEYMSTPIGDVLRNRRL